MAHATRAILATVLWSALLVSTSAGKTEREESTQSYKVGKSPRVSLSNLNGTAEITGWNGDTIEVRVTKFTSGPRARLDDVVVNVDLDGDHLRIEVEYEDTDDWHNDGVSVDFEIRVPRATSLVNVKLVNGDLKIRDLAGDIEASSVNGEVSGIDLSGKVHLSTVNGDVSLVSVGDEPIWLKSVNGGVTLVLPKNVNADISASTIHGDISGKLARGVTHAGSSMDAVLGSGGRRIELVTVNGDIEIRRAGGDDARKGSRDSDDDSE